MYRRMAVARASKRGGPIHVRIAKHVADKIGTPTPTKAPDKQLRKKDVVLANVYALETPIYENVWGWGRGFLFHR